MGFYPKLLVGLGLVVASNFGLNIVRRGYDFEVIPPARVLAEVPTQIGSWKATEAPIDDEALNVMNADEWINRDYQNGRRVISVCAATWLDQREMRATAPHHPALCYPSAGWNIVDQGVRTVKCRSGEKTIAVMQLEKSGERLVVYHWYQMGAETFHSSSQGRFIQKDLWGKKQWPAVSKFIVQTSGGLSEVDGVAETLLDSLVEWSVETGTSDARPASQPG